MTFEEILFWTIGLLTCLSAVSVVVTQNIVRAAVWLLFTLAGTAGLFFLLGAEFVGATQLLVYVGGILVLVVFGVMLTAQGPFISMKTGAGEWAIAIVVGLLLYGLLASSVFLADWRQSGTATVQDPATSHNADQLGLALLGDHTATKRLKLTAIPTEDRTRVSYLLLFEIVSVHLLVVLLGAAYLARAKSRKGAATT
jgi:NADH:ubiquinone oxidoreductase subunit 6 (subunit J)